LAIKAAGYAFEIIFLSSDEDEESAMEYFKTMPWLMIKFEDRSLDEDLSREFDISGNHVVTYYCLVLHRYGDYLVLLLNFFWIIR